MYKKMILIFDVYGGLCNQIIDIKMAIYFSIQYEYFFTFRNASLRNANMTTWSDIPFDQMFQDNFINYFGLYIPYELIANNINENNTYNYSSEVAVNLWKNITSNDEIHEKIVSISESFHYIVLKQFFPICKLKNGQNLFCIEKHLFHPNRKILTLYHKIRNEILTQPYNFLHYRYESDFVNHFRIKKIIPLDELINKIEFTDNNLPIYIALSKIQLKEGVHYTVDIFDKNYGKKIISKDDILKKYTDETFNYEEYAFLDYLIGYYAKEVYGHSKSSFSLILNNYHGTNHYFDMIESNKI